VEISRDDILALLAEHKLFASLTTAPDGEQPVAWDSLSLTWFLTRVERRYGLELDPGDIDPAELASVDKIHAYLRAALARVPR
jgi:hypothetical protein